LLNSRNDKNKNIFLVHDVSGDINGYILFSRLMEKHYNIYGLRVEPGTRMAPADTVIENMARSYIDRIKEIQPNGPYYIGGWSAGGLIAVAMAHQMEMSGEELGPIFMFDAAVPLENRNNPPFTLDGEIAEIKKNFEVPGFFADDINDMDINDMDELWKKFAHYLEEHKQYDAAYLEKIFPAYAALIPTFAKLDVKKILQQINIIRSVTYAVRNYSPTFKIKTPLQIYVPGASVNDPGVWKKICENNVDVYPVTGEHLTMLKEPHVTQLADLFQKNNKEVIK
jgi:thioesterase domain-containing protein